MGLSISFADCPETGVIELILHIFRLCLQICYGIENSKCFNCCEKFSQNRQYLSILSSIKIHVWYGMQLPLSYMTLDNVINFEYVGIKKSNTDLIKQSF